MTATRARIDRAYLESRDGRDLFALLDSCGVTIESVACCNFREPRFRARVHGAGPGHSIALNGVSFYDALYATLGEAARRGWFDESEGE